MAKGSKTRSNYVPRGPSPDIQPAPGPSGDAAAPVAGRVGHVRSASTAFGEPDEVLNVSIVPEVLAIAKRAKLSNSATNKLHELSEAVVAEQDLDDESNFSLHAPSSFLLAQSLVLANWDLLRTLNRKASSNTPAEASNGPRPKTQPAAAALDPNMLSSDAKKNIANITNKAFFSPHNPSLAAGGKIILQVALRRLRRDKAVLGANGPHLFKDNNPAGRAKILSRVKKTATRTRNELKSMIHCSLEGTDEEEAQDIRTFSDAVADKWGLDISYDFIVRMAWLRKMGSETIPIQSAGAAWWDNVQAELDILVSLCNHQDIAHQQKGQRCFERALQWEFDTHGRCDVLENEQRPAEEAALADDFLHAGEELIDAEEVVD